VPKITTQRELVPLKFSFPNFPATITKHSPRTIPDFRNLELVFSQPLYRGGVGDVCCSSMTQGLSMHPRSSCFGIKQLSCSRIKDSCL
jgi:hypothetical protein